MIIRALAVLMLSQLLSFTSVHCGLAAESDKTTIDGQLPFKIREFTGDLDEMAEERIIRVLMPYSKTFYFFDGAQPRGASYELIKLFETFRWASHHFFFSVFNTSIRRSWKVSLTFSVFSASLIILTKSLG